MPRPDETEPIPRAPFAYAVIRVVPRVEREEFLNAGVVLFSRPRRFLGVRVGTDADRLRTLWPDLDLDAVRRQLDVLCLVAAGDPAGGAISHLSPAERFGWLTAPASTVVQPGPVHAGLTDDPERALDELFGVMVEWALTAGQFPPPPAPLLPKPLPLPGGGVSTGGGSLPLSRERGALTSDWVAKKGID